MGIQDSIKYPTLEVRNPNELSRGAVQVTCLHPTHPQLLLQNKLFSKGPVYKQSTAEIEEKIREINSAVKAKIEAEQKKLEEAVSIESAEEALEALTDIAAVEIVAEQMAEAIVAEEVAEAEEMADATVAIMMEKAAEDLAIELVKEEVELEAAEVIAEAVSEEAVEAIEENIIESESTTILPEEAEVDFGDITEVV